jgi:hypothetical protein
MANTDDLTGPRPAKRRRRRAGAGLGTLALAAAAMSAMASPASADMTCTAHPDSNVCLSIEPIDGGKYHVHVGIDVHMSQQAAQVYVDQGFPPFQVVVFGSDYYGADQLFYLDQTDIGTSAETGLGADFDLDVPRDWLNEDDFWPFDTEDEIYARIALTRDVPRDTFFYYSNEISQEF